MAGTFGVGASLATRTTASARVVTTSSAPESRTRWEASVTFSLAPQRPTTIFWFGRKRKCLSLRTLLLSAAGFKPERFPWSVNFIGHSKVSLQLSTEDFYREFSARSVPADVHGILLRVASLEDTLAGKVKEWSDTDRRQSKRIKDLGDIARLVESHPHLWTQLSEELQQRIERPV